MLGRLYICEVRIICIFRLIMLNDYVIYEYQKCLSYRDWAPRLSSSGARGPPGGSQWGPFGPLLAPYWRPVGPPGVAHWGPFSAIGDHFTSKWAPSGNTGM
jgi:hypothetical protein